MPGLLGLIHQLLALPASASAGPAEEEAGLATSIALDCLAEAINLVCLAQAMAGKSKSVKEREAGNSAFNRMTEGLAPALMQVDQAHLSEPVSVKTTCP